MSWQATAWAAKQKAGSPAAKLLLLVLGNYADATGCCWPSQELLAADTEQSVDTVQRQLRKLQAAGLVRKVARPQGRGRWSGCTYFLSMPGAETTEPQSAARSEPEPTQATQSDHASGTRHRAAPEAPTVPHSCAVSPCRTAMRHEPSIEPSIEPSKQNHQHRIGVARASPKSKPSATERQQAFQRKRGGIEVTQNRIAQRIAPNGNGWSFLQLLSAPELENLTALEERGDLSARMLDQLRLRLMKAAVAS